MLKISQTRLLAACLGCLAIVVASIALAQDQQSGTQSNPSNQTQPATQSSPPTDLQLDSPATTQQQPSDQASQPSSQPSADAQKSNASGIQKSSSGGNATSNASRSAPGNPDWPAPKRYNPNNPQGGSLGISISADGQGIIISRVHSGTPAQQMGLRPRDRITSVNGQQVSNSDQFISIIRNMNAGDEVELAIVRDDAPTTLKGKLEAYSQALARTPEAREGSERSMIRSPGMRSRIADEAMNSNVQTSYEERTSGRQPSGDIESRLTNLEQQLSQLRQDVAEIRVAVRSNPTSGAQPPVATPPAAQGGPRTPSVFPPTPGEPPSVQRNAGQPTR
jgi:hypothetical protein